MAVHSQKWIRITGALAITLSLAACTSGSSDETTDALGTTQSTGKTALSQISLEVYDSSGSLVYSDQNASTALVLKAGTQYDFRLSGSQVPSGTTFQLQATNIDVINGTPKTTTLSLGDNTITTDTAGDYLYAITAAGQAASTVASKAFQASVTCANPNFTASSLNAQAISVTSGSGSNLYTYSASGVTSGANGTGPYLCAWDVNGDGTQDTPFKDCNTAISNEYVNYVGTRNVGLIVKDSCNVPQTVSKAVNLAYTVPSKPGNNFIFGQLSNATGTAQSDPRVDGVTYLATNSAGHNIVKPQYALAGTGKGSFTINSTFNYGLLSSVNFGMQLNVGNITDTINLSTMTGTVDASAATLKQTRYNTDQSGDQSPAQSFLGSNCTLSNPGAQVKFQQGTPCSAGTTGDNNSADVEVWGDYVCTVTQTTGNVTITGSFDGIAHLADNCVGGGGGGGGGITPIGL